MKTVQRKRLSKSVKEVSSKDYGRDLGERKEIVQKEEMKDSPFTVVTIGEESFGVMGGYRLTEKTGTKKEVIEELEKMTWNRIVQVMMILGKIREEQVKE